MRAAPEDARRQAGLRERLTAGGRRDEHANLKSTKQLASMLSLPERAVRLSRQVNCATSRGREFAAAAAQDRQQIAVEVALRRRILLVTDAEFGKRRHWPFARREPTKTGQ